jgi:adenine C2-methylase RlmN of 23S rRNA A2503 and tRNA A37/NTP pyrophosphatase (non-canonical NTP hydrolase)
MEEYIMNCSLNNKTDIAISRLMNGSIWGQTKEIESLIKDLQKEFNELTEGISINDIANCFEESADVLMLILCILYKLSPYENEYISKVITMICTKLQCDIEELNINDMLDKSVRNSYKTNSIVQKYSILSLSNIMIDEFNKLSDEIYNKSVSECFNKSADLLLAILYVLNKLSPDEETYITTILTLLNEKLARRYGSVLNDSDGHTELNIENENAIWKRAKKEELRYDLVYCPNPHCENYCDIINAKIETNGNECKCEICGNRFKINSSCVLLGEYYKNKRKYLTLIAEAFINKNLSYGSVVTKLLNGTKVQRKAYIALQTKIIPNDNKTLAFIKYMNTNHAINEKTVKEFLNIVKKTPLYKKRDVLSDYIQSDFCENKSKQHYFSISDIKQIHKQLFALDELGVKHSIEKEIAFEARGWNSQFTKKLVLQYDDVRQIECMAIVHYKGSEIRDLTFELSNMYGCPVRCAFCASGELTQKFKELRGLDFIRQINVLVNETGYSPMDFANFFVSFAGIGEPSITAKEISIGMRLITELYPHVKFNIATIGFNQGCFDVWMNKHTNIRIIQIPYYSSENATLKKIAQNLPGNYDLKSVISSAIKLKKTNKSCRVKINYIVICGYNDSNDDIERMAHFLLPFKKEVEVKVSYLNETTPSKQMGLQSPVKNRMDEINSKISDYGFKSYVFGTELNPVLGCGQLVQNCLLDGE